MFKITHRAKLPFLIFLLLITIFIWLIVLSGPNSGVLEINFFDVGQGDAIFIETANGNQILIDGGPNKSILAKLGEEMPFYDRKIDLVILTHPDSDHLTGLVEVLKRYQIKQILTTGIKCQTAVCQKWLELIEEKDIPVEIARASQIINLDNSTAMTILYPFENLVGQPVEKENNTSIVSRLIYGQTSFLFTGDIEREIEEELVGQNINLNSDLLKIAHHGSKTSTSQLFLKAVSPWLAVISVGKDNRWGMPSGEVIKILEKENIKIYRTDLDGDIEVISNGQNLWVNQ